MWVCKCVPREWLNQSTPIGKSAVTASPAGQSNRQTLNLHGHTQTYKL